MVTPDRLPLPAPLTLVLPATPVAALTPPDPLPPAADPVLATDPGPLAAAPDPVRATDPVLPAAAPDAAQPPDASAPSTPAPGSKPVLTMDWASYEAAKAAVLRWHYSRAMPTAKLVKVGAWEDGQFIGVVLFGRGATINIGKPYNLEQTEVCELVRVALGPHRCQTSQVVARAVKMLKAANPGIRLIVSYADSGQNHHGGIYQAMNWIYVGSAGYHAYRIRGKLMHPKSIHSTYGHESLDWLKANVDPMAERVETAPKHKYLMPLDKKMSKQIEPLRKAYPKRYTGAEGAVSGTAGNQSAGGGASPTSAHQLSPVISAGSADSGTPSHQLGRDGANPIPALHPRSTTISEDGQEGGDS